MTSEYKMSLTQAHSSPHVSCISHGRSTPGKNTKITQYTNDLQAKHPLNMNTNASPWTPHQGRPHTTPNQYITILKKY